MWPLLPENAPGAKTRITEPKKIVLCRLVGADGRLDVEIGRMEIDGRILKYKYMQDWTGMGMGMRCSRRTRPDKIRTALQQLAPGRGPKPVREITWPRGFSVSVCVMSVMSVMSECQGFNAYIGNFRVQGGSHGVTPGPPAWGASRLSCRGQLCIPSNIDFGLEPDSARHQSI